MGISVSDEELQAAIDAVRAHPTKQAAADFLDWPVTTLKHRLGIASRRGLLGTKPVLHGFEITKTTAVTDQDGNVVREFVQQKPEQERSGFNLPDGHSIKGVSAYLDGNGNVIGQWVKTTASAEQELAAMRAVAEAFKDELPRAEPVPAPLHADADLLNQYTITDNHLGALAWDEETGGGDYDLAIGEKLLVDWFEAAIRCAPPAYKAVLAQLGDFLHYDSFKSITPEHGHVLDADSRYPKMVRSAIRILRRVIDMLLSKYQEVELILCDDNHSPTAEVWLREMFSAFFENEPRLKVNTHPGTYSYVEHGMVSLFYHHGHRRGIKDVDSVFVGKYREIYGRTKYSYAHLGHLHSDELKSTNLMKVERHETLAAPDAYAANGGWLSGRSAKVITYHKVHGEVGRLTLSPGMVAGASARLAHPHPDPLQHPAV